MLVLLLHFCLVSACRDCRLYMRHSSTHIINITLMFNIRTHHLNYTSSTSYAATNNTIDTYFSYISTQHFQSSTFLYYPYISVILLVSAKNFANILNIFLIIMLYFPSPPNKTFTFISFTFNF